MGVIASLTTIVANIYKARSDRLTIKAKKQELKTEQKTEQDSTLKVQLERLRALLRAIASSDASSDASYLLVRVALHCMEYKDRRLFMNRLLSAVESLDFAQQGTVELIGNNWEPGWRNLLSQVRADFIVTKAPKTIELPDDEPPPEPSPTPRNVRLATSTEVNRLPVHYSKQSLARYQKIITRNVRERILSWLRTFIRRFVLHPAFQPA